MNDIVERLRDSDTTRRIGESYADAHDRRQADRDEAADEITRLTAEVSELNSVFDARWSADMRAIERWRKENPGNELVLPDHVNLCLWLMEERTRLTAENERLNKSRNKWGQKYNTLLEQHKVTVSQLKAAVWSDSEECKLLTAEVEKLRAALKKINVGDGWAALIARAALEGK